MSETEIELARTYLEASGRDPVGALIRSVRDLARLRRVLASAPGIIEPGAAEALLYRLAARARPIPVAG